mgnify:CR=1 FL=1
MKAVRVSVDHRMGGGNNKGYAFVEYLSKEAAEKAIAEMNGELFMGKHVYVDWALQVGPHGRAVKEKSRNLHQHHHQHQQHHRTRSSSPPSRR